MIILDSFYVNQDGELFPPDSALYSTFGELQWGVSGDIEIPDHVQRALSLLIEQFKKKPNINSIVKATVVWMQELEKVFSDLYYLRSLDHAIGVQLDGIGDLVGQPRNGLPDDEYRGAIKFRIFLNKSSGEPETLVALVSFITDADKVRIWEIPNATVQLFTDGSFIPENIVEATEAVASAGVNIEYIGASYGVSPMVVVEDGETTAEYGMGLSEEDYAPAGVELGGAIVEGYIN